MNEQLRSAKYNGAVQWTIGFIIPTVVLFALSSVDRLGPRTAMLLALLFPVTLELYRLVRHRKPSVISVTSIVGILLVGTISLLGLNEQWLAIRRSVVYAVGAVAIFAIVRFKPQLIDKGLARLLDIHQVREKGKTDGVELKLLRATARTGYLFASLLSIVAVASYALTIVMINSPTNSAQFNAEYAELRILSIFVVTLPFILCVTALLIWLLNQIEKLTGLPAEQLLKKKR